MSDKIANKSFNSFPIYGIIPSDKYELAEDSQMAKNERFEKVYSQGALNVTEIWVDKETSVNYVFHQSGYAGGMTPLLDKEGKPVISPIING